MGNEDCRWVCTSFCNRLVDDCWHVRSVCASVRDTIIKLSGQGVLRRIVSKDKIKQEFDAAERDLSDAFNRFGVSWYTKCQLSLAELNGYFRLQRKLTRMCCNNSWHLPYKAIDNISCNTSRAWLRGRKRWQKPLSATRPPTRTGQHLNGQCRPLGKFLQRTFTSTRTSLESWDQVALERCGKVEWGRRLVVFTNSIPYLWSRCPRQLLWSDYTRMSVEYYWQVLERWRYFCYAHYPSLRWLTYPVRPGLRRKNAEVVSLISTYFRDRNGSSDSLSTQGTIIPS